MAFYSVVIVAMCSVVGGGGETFAFSRYVWIVVVLLLLIAFLSLPCVLGCLHEHSTHTHQSLALTCIFLFRMQAFFIIFIFFDILSSFSYDNRM